MGLHGFLVEYDLLTLSVKTNTSVTGEAAHCLDVNVASESVAIGTEKGYINVFSIKNDEIVFEKFLDKQEGRILCLKYDPSGKYIAGGSIDAIRVWDVGTGHALHRMTTGRSEANKMTVVWCLEFTDDLTVISGDSRGKLTFWDAKVGAQIECYQSHRADILSMCLSGDNLYCAGVDPNIVNYVKVNVKGENFKWVRSVQRKIHDHDVRSLILCDNKLYSGGVDGYLACSYYPPKTLLKYPPIMQNCIQLCPESRYIFLKYSNHLEVWLLSETVSNDSSKKRPSVDGSVKKLLSIQRPVKTSDGKQMNEPIICSAISNDGMWIMYSTNTILRLLRFNFDSAKPKLKVVPNLPDNCGVCLNATFSHCSSYLFIAPRGGGVRVLNLIGSVIEEEQFVDTSRSKYLLLERNRRI